jgi:hypothetical protein
VFATSVLGLPLDRPTNPSVQVAASKSNLRWLHVLATTDTDAPVVKAAGAFFVTIPIACLEAALYDRYWREQDIEPIRIFAKRVGDTWGGLALAQLRFLDFSVGVARQWKSL